MIKKEASFEDADQSQFSADNNLTFKDIVLQHLKKITLLASVEMRGGFWQQTPHPNPSINTDIKVYIPDSREVYSNAVECLSDMLSPYFDKEMIEAEEKVEKEILESYKKNTILQDGSREFKNQNSKVNFKIESRIQNKKLFRDLCKFLFRKRYLELGTIDD